QERLERSESTDVGLRVLIGLRQAVVSSSDLSADGLRGMVERAVAMARAVPGDPYCGLAAPSELAGEPVDVDGCDAAEPTPEALLARAACAEEAARAVAGVTNSEGAEATWSFGYNAVAATNGFARAYARSRHGLTVSVLAGEGTAMERDYDYTTAVHGEDLRDPAAIGRSAGERAVARLGPRKISSAQVPVVYDPRVAGSLLGHLAAAVNGTAIARGTTFLKDRLGTAVFPAAIEIIDDPLRRRGLRSRPFDAEGIATRPLKIVDGGTLASWILDLRSARQLGMESTGHAARGISSPPSPSISNLYMAPGTVGRAALIAGVARGFYVTELIGFGVNGVTGDYSRGASGFWIEDGRLAYPVSEITIAGNLLGMFANLTAADDLHFRYATDAPTLRIDGMTLAGR
ncbi:MAG: TldD/PmbA family protein, partial [Rhodospirillales bacterium]